MLKTDQYIAHYHILEKLGQGGMGVVYKAHDTKLDRYVALKFLPPVYERDATLRDRMQNEARAIASLNHPNITSIYAIEDIDDESFIVMEYINGRELCDVIKDEALTPEQLMDITKQLVNGLKAAHDRGVIHRDIKSANIMLTTDNRIKIMDFGLAKAGALTELTVEGTTMGTASYMSPEQAMGKEITVQSDIWSLGVVLYELATGELPFSGAYEQAVIYALLNDDARPVTSFRDDLPPVLIQIIEKCMQREPEQRYISVQEIIADLENGISAPALAKGTEEQVAHWQLPFSVKIRKRLASYLLPSLIIIAALVWAIPRFVIVPSGGPGQRVLVLPFTHIGNDEQLAAFCDGMVETLTSKLTQMEQYHQALWVVPAGEVRRNQVTSPGEAYKTFGANLAVTGSMQMIGDVFRLTLNLVDAQKLRQLSSRVIDVQRSQILQIQDRTVSILVDMLDMQQTPASKSTLNKDIPANPVAYEYYLQGRGYLQNYESLGQIDTAIELLKKAIQEDSTYALAISGLGEAYWRKYNLTKDQQWVELARDYCETAFRLQPDLAPICNNLGTVQLGAGQYQEALAIFKRAIGLDPENAGSYRGLAKSYEALNMLDEAEDTYLKSISLKPDYWVGYNDLGVYYYKHGQYDDAVRMFAKIIELVPASYRGYNSLGAMYYLQEKWQQARELFEKSIEMKPTYSAATNLGTLYYIEKQYEKAIAMYQLALRLNDNEFVVWGNLAAAYQQVSAGKAKVWETYRHAIEMAEKQLGINPNDPVLLSMLADYYSTIEEKTKSLSLIERAIKLAPENVEVMYHASSVYEKQGNRNLALQWVEKALKSGYSLSEIENQPELQALYKDKRFQNMINNM